MKLSSVQNSTSKSRVLSPSLEVRKLNLRAKTRLINLLDMDNCWMKLAEIIHMPDGTYLYTPSNIKMLKDQGNKPGCSPAQSFLEHWETVGKKLPTLKDLLELLIEVKLYQIADYVSVELLKGDQISSTLTQDATEQYETMSTPCDSGFSGTHCEYLEQNVMLNRNSSINKHDSVQVNQEPPKHEQNCTFRNNCFSYNLPERVASECDLNEVQCYKYSVLENITRNFSNISFHRGGNLLGEGAFGAVYHGVSPDGQHLAIKRLKGKVDKQFATEIEVLTKYRHINLLPLLGYSCDGAVACLVYSFIVNGSLQERLAEKSNPVLTWQRRIKISIDTARGICHLHTFGEKPLVHRDIKSANVLLDENYTAKVGDFGLVRVGDSGTTTTVGVTTTVFGTPAYMALEAYRGDVSEKLDTFSYGVVLLELLTGLPPFDESREEKDLLSYVLEHDDINSLLDSFAGQWDTETALALYDISKLCTEEKKRFRPTMVQVLPKVEALLK